MDWYHVNSKDTFLKYVAKSKDSIVNKEEYKKRTLKKNFKARGEILLHGQFESGHR